MPRTVAIIPARSGSKRLPHKNVMELDGRPLMAYSILVANSTPGIDETWVTTDSPEYSLIAQEWGARVIMRPEELAADDTSTLDTLRHVLQHPPSTHWANYIPPPDWLVLLQPNCPLRHALEIEQMIYAARDEYPDGVLSVQSGKFKMGSLSRSGYWRPRYKFGSRKQSMAMTWREDGNRYIFKADNIWRKKRLHGKAMGIDISRWEQSLANIDVMHDFILTELLYNRLGYAEYFANLEKEWKAKLAAKESTLTT